MIEFRIGRNRSGKRRRPKRPRMKILKKGRILANWYFGNWIRDDYRCIQGNIKKFLLHNVGRPVNDVLHDYVSRCRFPRGYSPEGEFYSWIEDWRWARRLGGFYVSEDGTLRHSDPDPDSEMWRERSDYAELNRETLPRKRIMIELSKDAEEEEEIKFIGSLWCDPFPYKTSAKPKLRDVYVTTIDTYKKKYYYMDKVSVRGLGVGYKREFFWNEISYVETYYWNPPYYIFVVKHKKEKCIG